MGDSVPNPNFMFLFDLKPVPYCTHYKYLGSNINEYLDFTFTADKHCDSAGRALSSLITKMIKNNGFPYNVFTLLYNACVNSIADYSGAIIGFQKVQSSLKLHLRAIRAFFGLPKNACIPGILSEVDLLTPHYRNKLHMVRHYHRMMKMADSRLTKRVMLWDKQLNKSKIVSTWTSEVQEIFRESNMLAIFDASTCFHKKEVISKLSDFYLQKQKIELEAECYLKPKLRTFLKFKDFSVLPAYIKKPLTFAQRRMLAKTRLGCLPIRMETGRYERPRLEETERICLVCRPNDQLVDLEDQVKVVESETHFLYYCKAYSDERDLLIKQMTLPSNFLDLNDEEKLKLTLNDPLNVKFSSQFILNAFNKRSTILM